MPAHKEPPAPRPDWPAMTASDATSISHALPSIKGVPVVVISQKEVASGQTGDTLARLMAFSDTPENVRKFAGRLYVIISGYEQDPRPLLQIDQVRHFIRLVTREWPYWLHFLAPDLDGLANVLLLLMDVNVVRDAGDFMVLEVASETQFRQLFDHLTNAMRVLHDFARIPEEVSRRHHEGLRLFLARHFLWSAPPYPAG